VNKGAAVITGCNAVLLVGLVLFFSAADAIASFSGPKDDIGLLALLVPFIVWHALIISRHGPRVFRNSALILLGVLGALLLWRYFDTLTREGRWHANRSIHIFVWSAVWFCCVGILVRWRCRHREARERRRSDSEQPLARYDY
jgi:hypothetical protein